MTANRMVTIWCDGFDDDGRSCGAWFTDDTARYARAILGAPGGGRWLVNLPGGRDLCPVHQDQRNSDRKYGDPS